MLNGRHEAHCISTWGPDFRLDYMELDKFVINFRKSPSWRLRLLQYIVRTLKLKSNYKEFQTDLDRPNIKYTVVAKTGNAVTDIHTLISNQFAGQCRIVYCCIQKDAEEVAKQLNNLLILLLFERNCLMYCIKSLRICSYYHANENYEAKSGAKNAEHHQHLKSKMKATNHKIIINQK